MFGTLYALWALCASAMCTTHTLCTLYTGRRVQCSHRTCCIHRLLAWGRMCLRLYRGGIGGWRECSQGPNDNDGVRKSLGVPSFYISFAFVATCRIWNRCPGTTYYQWHAWRDGCFRLEQKGRKALQRSHIILAPSQGFVVMPATLFSRRMQLSD